MTNVPLPKSFLQFVAASGFTNLADGIALFTWGWLASLVTRDPLLIALLPVFLRIPWFLCAIPAGLITDRVDRRRLILAMDVLRGVVFGFAALAVWMSLPLAEPSSDGASDERLYLMLLMSALLIGTAEVFRDNAAQTILPDIVADNQLEKANGRLWSVELTGNQLAGPAIGSVLIAVSTPLPLAINALLFVLAVFLLTRITGDFRVPDRVENNWRVELKEAFQFLWSQPLLRSLAWITGVWNLLFEMMLIGLILHVQENLNLGAPAFGLILAAGAVGGIIGGWTGDKIVTRFGRTRTAQWSLMASAPIFMIIALAPNAWALAFALLLMDFSGITWNTVSVAYRQRKIPSALLGRVNSMYRLIAWGMMPVGMVLSGLVVRIGETAMPRENALILPFYLAAFASLLLGVVGWKALARGFEQEPDL